MAWVDGAPAGFALLYPTYSSLRLGRWWVLNDLYVIPRYRRRGIGAGLLRRAATHARRAEGIGLETARSNPARALYERLGWRKDRAFVHYALVRGGMSPRRPGERASPT